jgi:hypothetical protein
LTTIFREFFTSNHDVPPKYAYFYTLAASGSGDRHHHKTLAWAAIQGSSVLQYLSSFRTAAQTAITSITKAVRFTGLRSLLLMQFTAIFATNGSRQAARLGIPLRTKPLHPTTSVVSTISRMAARFIGRAIPGLISFMATYIKGGFLKGAKEELWDTLSQTKPLHLTTFVASTISVMAPQFTGPSHTVLISFTAKSTSSGCLSAEKLEYLGYPVTDESPTGTRGGRYNDFLNGSIYSSAATGQAHDHRGPLPDSVDFQQNHTFPEGVALGGWSHVTLHSNGGVTSSGHMHDSGAPDYSYSILWVLIDADNSGYTLIHDGECHGDAPGSRDSDWNEVHTQAALVVAAN